jgi:acylphosphatase
MHVIFSGRVQGVGFRYTVCRLAAPFSVTGFVRNLWDGDVELVAEGDERELSDFLHTIRTSELRRNIMENRISWKEATGTFEQFGISY